jgi:signal transduction histidine kinase
VSISNLTRETLAAFDELIQMKSIDLQVRIEKGVYIPLHLSLADLLLTNLISNAIRHNDVPVGTEGDARNERVGATKGLIRVELTQEGLVVINTGREPGIPTRELFERFKKGNSGSDSIGIGLAIVRQICELSHFDIDYQYHSGLHMLAVSFLPKAPASKLLQNLSLPLPLDAAGGRSKNRSL